MKDPKEIREFAAFMQGHAEPPRQIEEALFEKIRTLLNPSLPFTFGKLFLFHVIGSFIALLFCPQFGISLTGSMGLMGYFMRVSPGLCFFGCGLLWMVGGQALTYVFLTFDEQRVLGGYRWGALFTILSLSILLFGCIGALRIDEWLLFWVLGAATITASFNWPILSTLHRFRNSVRPAK